MLELEKIALIKTHPTEEGRMLKLMVSYNCGASYQLHKQAETSAELQTAANKFDKEGLRWVIENDGEIESISLIHQNIVKTFSDIFGNPERESSQGGVT